MAIRQCGPLQRLDKPPHRSDRGRGRPTCTAIHRTRPGTLRHAVGTHAAGRGGCGGSDHGPGLPVSAAPQRELADHRPMRTAALIDVNEMWPTWRPMRLTWRAVRLAKCVMHRYGNGTALTGSGASTERLVGVRAARQCQFDNTEMGVHCARLEFPIQVVGGCSINCEVCLTKFVLCYTNCCQS